MAWGRNSATQIPRLYPGVLRKVALNGQEQLAIDEASKLGFKRLMSQGGGDGDRDDQVRTGRGSQ